MTPFTIRTKFERQEFVAQRRHDILTATDTSGAVFWPTNPRVSSIRGLKTAIRDNRGTWNS